MRLCLVPVGEDIEIELLDDLAAELAQRLRIGCHVTAERVDAAFAYHAGRNQYWSTALLKHLRQIVPEDDRIVGVTALDLYVPVLTFVFGEAQVGGRAAIVSTHRLRNELYGMPAEFGLMSERLVKETMHEIGHTYGLRHCGDWQCVMSSSHAVERLDTKTAEFCRSCAAMMASGASVLV